MGSPEHTADDARFVQVSRMLPRTCFGPTHMAALPSARNAHTCGRSSHTSVAKPQRSIGQRKQQRDLHIARFQPLTDARMSKRDADLAVRKVYLVGFWYAAGFTNKLRQGAASTTILLDTHVCLWRSPATGQVHIISNSAPDTGEALMTSSYTRTAPMFQDGPHGPELCALISKADSVASLFHASKVLRTQDVSLQEISSVCTTCFAS